MLVDALDDDEEATVVVAVAVGQDDPEVDVADDCSSKSCCT